MLINEAQWNAMTLQQRADYQSHLLQQGVLREQEQAQLRAQEEYRKWEAEQVERIRQEIPEWGDDESLRRGMQGLRQWVVEEKGVSPEIAMTHVPDAQTVISYYKARQSVIRKRLEEENARRPGRGHYNPARPDVSDMTTDEAMDHIMKVIGDDD